MEVIGAIASVGAILGGTRKTFDFVRSIAGIEDDWQRLNDEIDGIATLIEEAKRHFPSGVPDQPHTASIRKAFRQLEQVLSDLNTLSKKVSPERKKLQPAQPRKMKWLYLKEDIASIQNRLRDAKIELDLALRLADRRDNAAMVEAFHAMVAEFGTMTIHFRTNAGLHQQLHHFLEASQRNTENGHARRIEDQISSAVEESGQGESETSTQQAEASLPLQQPLLACSRPCFCRCHLAGVFSWARCDYDRCQRNLTSKRTSWSLNLSRWLNCYGVSFTISASLRPRLVITSGDIRAFEAKQGSGADLQSDRRCFFQAHQLLYVSQASEREKLIVQKLLSWSDEEVAYGSTALHRAVLKGSSIEVLDALEKEPSTVSTYNPGEQDPTGHTLRDHGKSAALHYAMRSEAPHSVEIVQLLLEAGADPGAKARTDGRTPLHVLAFSAAPYAICKSKVDLLLAAGIDIDVQDEVNSTPFAIALDESHADAARAFADSGSALDRKGLSDFNSCHIAAISCHSDALMELLRHNTFRCAVIDPYARDKYNNTPWDLFIYVLHLPEQVHSSLVYVTEDRARAFEAFYIQIRDNFILDEMQVLQQVNELLRNGDRHNASKLLLSLADKREPRDLWRTGLDMHPLRSLSLQIRKWDISDCTEAIEDQLSLLREKLSLSPWENQSTSWGVRPKYEGASEEDWQRQAHFANRMRREGLARWKFSRTKDVVRESVDFEEDEDGSTTS
ncbi:hypothetical protein NLU13_3136 [Sarocladium strictum]|uniref:Uncharacterized protein n=1 Tax=Sarocladium strictum TaxID=5046 RepID=A0AA39GM61_SARSR|nr:hypothetical protein NLU13_3136 [Sarocladium strictum]